MNVIVPYSPVDPKSRLSPVLSPEERFELSQAMVRDVIDVIDRTGHQPTILAPEPVAIDDVPVIVDDRSLSRAVNAVFGRADLPVGLVMADLALATESALTRLFRATADVAIAPGRRGGTNALLVDHPSFVTDFHDLSYRDHRRICDEIGADVRIVDSFRLATDIDEPDDLLEVVLHTSGRTRQSLLELTGGRAPAQSLDTAVTVSEQLSVLDD